LNKLHGPMHYQIGVTCVYTEHRKYTILLQHDLVHIFYSYTFMLIYI